MSRKYLVTSESVADGHPDCLSDQIADAILDECLRRDKNSRVACEVLCTRDLVVLAGEITCLNPPDFEWVARDTIKKVGYVRDGIGFDYRSSQVVVQISQQSPDIAKGVDETNVHKKIGAGDQGINSGYATNESDNFMPVPIDFAHGIMRKIKEYRDAEYGIAHQLLPDGKCQVSVLYEDGVPKGVTDVVVSNQHEEELPQEDFREFMIQEVVRKVIPSSFLSPWNTSFFMNPTGRFVVGGPAGDTGVTGRKLAVSTYGGVSRIGGGALCGKDPTKVDRSAAYMTRWVAKNLVAAGLARRCEILISYCIGYPFPISLEVDTFGTGIATDETITQFVKRNFDWSPGAIIERFDLLRPIYQPTASFGHFGRSEFPWEEINSAPYASL